MVGSEETGEAPVTGDVMTEEKMASGVSCERNEDTGFEANLQSAIARGAIFSGDDDCADGKLFPNGMHVVCGSGNDAAKSVSLQSDEASGTGSAEPDPEVAAAVETLRAGRFGYRFVKRAFDIIFSTLMLVLLCWLFLIVAIAIKIDDPKGPVFFGQERMGENGKRFYMWKFRSMVSDAEARLEGLQTKNEKTGPVFKMKDDPRVTRVGRFIRKTSIDELPQFLNVFLGQIPLRILKMRPEFSDESMGAFALPAKSSTNGGKAFSQVASCFANGLRARRISKCNSNFIGGMKVQFLAKPVFGAVCA